MRQVAWSGLFSKSSHASKALKAEESAPEKTGKGGGLPVLTSAGGSVLMAEMESPASVKAADLSAKALICWLQ